MKNSINQEIINSLKSALIDRSISSNEQYKPQFLSNDYKTGRKVLANIEEELLHCDMFYISVAFITVSGITPLLQTLEELQKRNVHGYILTTDYLCFSEPKALKKLDELENIELRIYHCSEEAGGFHTKGYIFKREEVYNIIVGSSNITLSALTKNREWNTRIVCTESGEYFQKLMDEFNTLWNSEYTKMYKEFIDAYQKLYKMNKMIEKNKKSLLKIETKRNLLKPNKMQLAFIENYRKFIDSGENKALLISATGTGKTYASAFAVKTYSPKKILFLVHREQIAKQAIKSYQRIFGDSKTFGLLSGDVKDYQADYLFSTMQMMTKQETLNRYTPVEFDTIIIDEVHRAGSGSYQRIMNYFKPRIWLGMTASPERTDGYDVFGLFDHNIAYEIRLQQALEENMLCPFHYFGITDLEIDGQPITDDSELSNFNLLVSDERVDYVIEKANYYGYSGERVKGLIFCRSKKEGIELSDKFNKRGLRTLFLDGSTSPEKREDSIDRLVNDDREDQLDYILTIDIFNEGVDIPEINQVIMLRPTQSSIIFVQQLGRGLRKAKDKEFVVILDFIGNYSNNFLIPIALSGDRSYNKDNLRKYISEGTRIIPGSSSIHFDEISRQRIYSSIDHAKTNTLKLLQESYRNLKYKLGRIPKIKDFSDYGEIDIQKIFAKCGSYYHFLVNYEKEYTARLSPEEANVIHFISTKLTKGKRVHELQLLKCLLTTKTDLWPAFKSSMQSDYGIGVTDLEKRSIVNQLTNQFAKETDKAKYKDCVFIEMEKGRINIAPSFEKMLHHDAFFEMLVELLDYGISQFVKNFSNRYKNTNLTLNQKYTYEDICLLLNWKRNANAQNIGGYFYDKETKTLPVFINYDKEDDAIAYEDRFISQTELIALSKHPRKIDSSDVVHIYKTNPEELDNRIYLFIRKNKDDQEAKEFYFLGEIYATGKPEAIIMPDTNDSAFEITYVLDVPVQEEIYHYLKNE